MFTVTEVEMCKPSIACTRFSWLLKAACPRAAASFLLRRGSSAALDEADSAPSPWLDRGTRNARIFGVSKLSKLPWSRGSPLLVVPSPLLGAVPLQPSIPWGVVWPSSQFLLAILCGLCSLAFVGLVPIHPAATAATLASIARPTLVSPLSHKRLPTEATIATVLQRPNRLFSSTWFSPQNRLTAGLSFGNSIESLSTNRWNACFCKLLVSPSATKSSPDMWRIVQGLLSVCTSSRNLHDLILKWRVRQGPQSADITEIPALESP